jgi:hypothetical protein
VGYLYLAAGAFRDTTYTAVDGTSDCVGGSTSVTLSSGKYGCAIGNTVALTLGRFVPDRFTVTAGTTAPACSVTNGFTYFAQTDGFATPFQLKAVNSIGAGSTTQNYTGVFAKLGNGGWVWSGTSSATGLRFGTSAALPGGAVLAVATSGGLDVVPAGTWANGTVSLSNVKHQISRPTALTGETAVTVTTLPIDSDGVTTTAATPVSGATALRYGRIRMLNTYGSEKLPLSVPIQAQYYDATVSGFKPNTDDSCTPVSVPTARTLSASPPTDGVASRSFYPLVTGANQLSSTDTTASMGTTLASGAANMAFTAPGKRGWLDIILTMPDHLKANWGNCWGQSGTAGLMDDLPCARATFGVYKSPLLYRRENY